MQNDPWAEFRTGAQQPAQPTASAQPQPQPLPSTPAAPGIIRGPERQIRPIEQERLRNEEARIGIAQEGQARQDRAEARGAIGEQQSFVLATRIGGGIDDLNEIYRQLPQANGAPSLGEAALYNTFGPNSIITRGITDDGRKLVEDVQMDILDALLTLGTGAAYNAEQLEGQRAAYFPQFGDDETAIDIKRRRLGRLFEAAKRRAGPLASDLEGYQSVIVGQETEEVKPSLTPEQNQLVTEFWNSPQARSSSPEDVAAWYRQNNIPPPSEEDVLAGIRSAQSGTVNFRPFPEEDGVSFRGVPGLEGDYSLSSIGEGLSQGLGSVIQGIGDTVGMVTDPFAGLMAEALGYDSRQMESLGTVSREGAGLERVPEGINRQAIEVASGALAGGLAARGAATAVNPGTAQNVLAQVGRTPVRDTVAGAGAGAGAAIGEEYGGVPGQIGGLVLGGLLGYGTANTANALAGAVRQRSPSPLVQASGRQGVSLLPADTGGPVARAVTTGTRASPVSITPVANAAEAQQSQFGDALSRTAGRQGEVVDTQEAGELVAEGAREFSKQSAQRGSRLYDRAASLARDVRSIRPLRTMQAVDDALERLRQNPAAESNAIGALERFRSNIEGGVSIQGLRDARTTLSQGVYDGQLRSSTDQAMWRDILGNVADDVEGGLRAAGRDDAAQTFKMADRLWTERIQVIDEALSPILGRDGQKGGEEVLQAIEGMARGQRGGNRRLSRVLGALEPEQANNVRATIVTRLGASNPGAQNAEGTAFSAATFLSNWNRMTPQGRASLFPDGGIRSSLNDLAEIAEGTKRTQALTNTSNTGVAITSANMIAGGAGAAANLPMTLAVGTSVYLTGKLMANPQFARLLARTAQMPPEAANRTFREQLALLATRQPQLSDDIGRLTSAINDNGRLAAQENEPQN